MKKKYRNIISIIVLVIGLGLVTTSLLSIKKRVDKTAGTAMLPEPEKIIEASTDAPAENKPVEEEYIVPADQPRRILIESIAVTGLIQKIGLTSAGAVAVPDNIHYAGWYVNSKKPGDKGLSIIDGHASGIYNDGIFKSLKKLKAGDTYQVEYGDKTTKNFEVTEVAQLPEDKSTEKLFSRDPNIENQLNLITCGGKYNKDSETFDDRIIVVSKLVDSE